VDDWLDGQPRLSVDLAEATPSLGWYALRHCPNLRVLVLGEREWSIDELTHAVHLEVGNSSSCAMLLAPFVAQNRQLNKLALGDGGLGCCVEYSRAWLDRLGGRACAPASRPETEVSLVSSCDTVAHTTLVFAAALLKHNGSARSLRLCDANIDERGVDVIVECLGPNSTSRRMLRSLNLSQNPAVGEAGWARVITTLRSIRTLRRLALQANGISAQGGVALGELLANAPALRELDLLGNVLGCAGVGAIARGLSTNSSLHVLNLRSNRVGDEGAEELGLALKTNRTLYALLLSWNRIGDRGAAALAHGLASNARLRELNLLENCISDKGAEALREGLQANSTLSCCSLQANKVQGSIVAELEAWLASIHHYDDPYAEDGDAESADGSRTGGSSSATSTSDTDDYDED
jgi:Ran GTPase-activating protein (RanGAP) involved in mRNA processing and transport